MATTVVIDVPKSNRNQGTYTFDVTEPVPEGLRYANLVFPMDDVDKLAVGKTVTLRSSFAPTLGGVYAGGNSTNWTSYGPAGFTRHNIDGTVTVNPNPEISIGLVDSPGNLRVGLFLRGSITLGQRTNIGVTVSIIS